MLYDNKAKQDMALYKKSLCFWVLASSFAYYIQDESLLSDELFDKMCKELLDNYDNKCYHHSILWEYMNKNRLQAGSFYDMRLDEYPLWLVRMTQALLRQLEPV